MIFETKKSVLYLGLAPPLLWNKMARGILVHLPIIQIVPRPLEHAHIQHAYQHIGDYTHYVFTSQSTVKLFFSYAATLIAARMLSLEDQKKIYAIPCIAVGTATAKMVQANGGNLVATAAIETAEGLALELKSFGSQHSHFFLAAFGSLPLRFKNFF